MTRHEFAEFLEKNKNIEWQDDVDHQQICFRNVYLDWYRNDEQRCTAVKYWKIDDMTAEDLLTEINRGLMVEGITRITGYFTKITSWNPGKRGELMDRKRFSVAKA